MSVPAIYWAYSIAAIAVLAVLTFVAKDENKKRLQMILLIAMSVFVAAFMSLALVGNRLLKTNVSVSTDQAELQLRLYSCIAAVEHSAMSEVARLFNEKAPAGKDPGAQARDRAYSEAEKSLRSAVESSKDNFTYKAKLAIVLGSDDSSHWHPENRAKISNLVEQLKAHESKTAEGAAFSALGAVIQRVYVDRSEPLKDVDQDRKTIELAVSGGWFRDTLTDDLYKIAHDTKNLVPYEKQLNQRYVVTFGKLILLFSIMTASGLIGAITVFVQLGLLGRKKAEPLPDDVGFNIPLRTVYTVFISWFCIQIAMSLMMHAVMAKYPGLTSRADLTALTTAATYLLSNLPAPLLIYFVAFKPNGLPFWETLRFRLKTSTSGPFKLAVCGWLAWCSAIPMILASAAIASKLLKTQGSDNPVIGQIVQAAGASNVTATLIFYFTLGVMAPFFEEILFRGFIYGALKRKIGAGWSMVASALLFAGLHFDKGGIMMLFAIGLVLAFTFERTRSLVPSMIAHGMWNSGTFTLALVLFGS